MIKSSVAVIGISAVLTVFAIFAFSPAVSVNATSCTSGWNVPAGTYAPGTTLTGTFTCSTTGSGSWTVYSCSAYSGTNNINCVGATTYISGSFSCPCSSITLFSQAFPQGDYQFQGSFNGGGTTQSFDINNYNVTPQFPAGMILAILAPIAALIGYSKFRKPAFPKVKA